MGIIIGFILIGLAIIINYLNLFRFEYTESWNGHQKGERVKHWTITYYVSWIFALIPFFGILFEAVWFVVQAGPCEYKCNSKLFKEC